MAVPSGIFMECQLTRLNIINITSIWLCQRKYSIWLCQRKYTVLLYGMPVGQMKYHINIWLCQSKHITTVYGVPVVQTT